MRWEQKCDFIVNIVAINSVRKNKSQYLHSDNLLNEKKIGRVFKPLKGLKNTLKEMRQKGFDIDGPMVEYLAVIVRNIYLK